MMAPSVRHPEVEAVYALRVPGLIRGGVHRRRTSEACAGAESARRTALASFIRGTCNENPKHGVAPMSDGARGTAARIARAVATRERHRLPGTE